MVSDMMLLVWLLLSAWMLLAVITTYGTILYRWRVRRPIPAEPAGPPVVLLVPVKGGGAGLDRFVHAAINQDGVVHRIVFSVESPDDPAFAQLSALPAESAVGIDVVVAGVARSGSQKVHNLLAALKYVQADDAVVVFADADSVPQLNWLAQLVRPVLRGRADICSGYLWMLPADQRLGSLLGAAISLTVATMPRTSRVMLCWGGSTAVSGAALEKLSLQTLWQGVLLDDLTLTRAARRAGLRMHASHFVLVPTLVSYSLPALLEYGRRQYFHIRIHAIRHWALAALVLGLPAVAALAALPQALAADIDVLSCYGVAFALQSARWSIRRSIGRCLLGRAFWGNSVPPSWLWPMVPWAHLLIFATSAFGHVIRWGGIRYRVTAPNRVEILRRADKLLRHPPLPPA
jgi:cellulose synthase/poly-beta-1,6-N-acetylglucosamine synthase-like glycosyltransferase